MQRFPAVLIEVGVILKVQIVKLFLFLLLATAVGDSMSAQQPGLATKLQGTEFIRTSSSVNIPQFTFELWFNAESYGVLINEVDSADVTKWDYSFAEITSAGELLVGLPGVPTLNLGTIPYQTWHYLAITYDKNNQTLSAYLDGELIATSKGERSQSSASGRAVLYAFGREGPKNLGSGDFYIGLLDEIRIWNRPLTPEEIKASWNTEISPTPEGGGLIVYYHLDEFNTWPQTTPDASAGNNPGLFVSGGINPTVVTSTTPLRLYRPPFNLTVQVADLNPYVLWFAGGVNAGGRDAAFWVEYWGDGLNSKTTVIRTRPGFMNFINYNTYGLDERFKAGQTYT